jgi:hypothetical protein
MGETAPHKRHHALQTAGVWEQITRFPLSKIFSQEEAEVFESGEMVRPLALGSLCFLLFNFFWSAAHFGVR